VVRTKLARFALQLPFSDARPLLTPLWTDIVGKETAAINILWRASSGSRVDRACFFMEPLVDGGSGNTADLLGKWLPRNWEKHCEQVQNIFDQRVGFTFLILENKAERAVEDVSLFFRETYSDNPLKADFNLKWTAKAYQQAITDVPTGDVLENLTARYSAASSAEDELKKRPLQEMKISVLKPGEKRIVLLNIYFASERNLPAGYLYGLYAFETAQYTSAGDSFVMKIRAPYLEKAARVAVPYGWFNQ
jgi:hypothetical protein